MPSKIDLTGFASRGRAFLADLADHNDRGWFRAQKGRYDAEVKRPAERLIEQVTPQLEARRDETLRAKLFRPHRDVRHSEDKTPYHTHLHALWSAGDGRAWFFGLAPDYATAGAGIMSFDPGQRAAWARAVAGPAGADLLDRLAAPGLRPAPPLDRDASGGPLADRVGLVVWIDGLEEALDADPVAALLEAYARLDPVQDWLATHL
jgi:hypothetical protein